MKQFKILTLLLGFAAIALVSSCNKDESKNTTFQKYNENNICENRSDCFDNRTNRIRINQNYSAVVKQCYENGQLIEVNYSVVSSSPNDKYELLNLTGGNYNNVNVRLDYFNTSASNITPWLNTYSSLTGGDVSYGCSCQSISNDKTDDCLVQRNGNLVYCTGNLCNACSLNVAFKTANNTTIIAPTSVILLPNNF